MTRVPEFLMFNKSQSAISNVREKMMKNQEQAVSGKRVNRASDDPVANMRAVGLRAQESRDDQIGQNLELAVSLVNITDSSLSELSDLLVRAKELAVQMSSTSNNNDDARAAVAKEIEQLKLRAIQIGNARLGDRYIFGGYTTTKPPFDEHGNYYGDDGVAQMEIDRGQRLSVNMPGIMPFFGITQIPEPAQPKEGEDGEAPPNGGPAVVGTMRSPASFLAERLGVEQTPENQVYQDLQRNSGVNIFYVLQNFSDGLKSGNIAEVQGSIDGLDASFRQVLQSRAMIGARQNALKMSQDSIEMAKESTATLISSTQDADVLKVFSDLAKNENSLKATLEMNRKILTPSLIEFLK